MFFQPFYSEERTESTSNNIMALLTNNDNRIVTQN